MKGFIELGTQMITKNYKGIDYLFEVMDYVLIVKGNTYNHKNQLSASGYHWDSLEKYWYKCFDNPEEVKMAYQGWNDTSEGLYATIKSNYRQVRPVKEV